MLRPNTFALTALLALLTGLAPLSMDMYLPSLPDIGRALHASAAQVQLTMSSYLIGFAVGQIFYGPISDRFGRKPVLLAALALFCVGSIICATTESIQHLVAMRFVQALGGAGSVVLGQAIVRDLYTGVRAGRELSVMGSIMGVAPIIAPLIGGVLQTAFGWHASFFVLVFFALAACSIVARLLPETLRQRVPGPFSLRQMGALYGSVLMHRGFLARLGILTACYVGLLVWVSGASIVLQGVYGLTPMLFGVAFACSSAGFLLGSNIAARIVMRLGLHHIIGIGTAVMATGGLIMAADVALGDNHVVLLVGSMMIYLVGLGMAMPQTMAGALTPFPDRAGTAASLMGFTQQSSAAIGAAVTGIYLGHSAWPVAGTVAAMGCLSFLVWLFTRRVRHAAVN
jgi:MFS transporter, DHA1 family, multidrug resistance protein